MEEGFSYLGENSNSNKWQFETGPYVRELDYDDFDDDYDDYDDDDDEGDDEESESGSDSEYGFDDHYI